MNLLSDDILEETEQLRLSLVQTEERMSFDPQTTIVNILDGGGLYIYNSAPIIVSVLLCEGQVIGLEDVSYTVSEDMLTQEVCAIIREGSIGRDVIVTLSTQPRSANGG